MKKTALFLAVLCGSGALAFGDMSAKIYVAGSLADDAGNGLVLDNKTQEYLYPGMLSFSYTGKNAGASFNLYSIALAGGSTVKFQKATVWLKPQPTLKLSLGEVGAFSYTEQLDWWKAPTAGSLANAGYSNNIASDGSAGLSLESTIVPSLTLTAVVAPGYGKGLEADEGKNFKFGGAAKYDIKDKGSAAVGYRWDGKGNPLLVHVGFDVAAVSNLYTFLNVVARVDDNTNLRFDGVALDWFGKYSLKDFTLQAHLPVTLRLTGLDGDVPYLAYNLKAEYALPALKLTPFLQAQQEEIDLTSFKVLPQINVGTAIGGWTGATLDVSFQYSLVEGGQNTWKVPFNANFSF